MVDEIETGKIGIAGVAFGGPYLDTLYLSAGTDIVQVLSATLTVTTFTGSALYRVTDLGTMGIKSTYFKLPEDHKRSHMQSSCERA